MAKRTSKVRSRTAAKRKLRVSDAAAVIKLSPRAANELRAISKGRIGSRTLMLRPGIDMTAFLKGLSALVPPEQEDLRRVGFSVKAPNGGMWV